MSEQNQTQITDKQAKAQLEFDALRIDSLKEDIARLSEEKAIQYALNVKLQQQLKNEQQSRQKEKAEFEKKQQEFEEKILKLQSQIAGPVPPKETSPK